MFESDSRWQESADIDRVNHQLPPPQLPQGHELLLAETSIDDQEMKAPKKRAETWVQDEIKALIAYRKEMDTLFNTSKSNKHLWEQISHKMKDRGFDRSPTMCTDKWRNLLKEYKKAKIQDRGSSKIACYKDLEELLGDRAKSTPYRSPAKSDGIVLSPKGASRAVNLERRLDHEDHAAARTCSGGGTPPVFVPNGVTPWCQRNGGANGVVGERRSLTGKVIGVRLGDLTRRVRIDGPFESIKESIKTAFGLRTKRPFWLEDDEGVVQTLSRDMPPGQYSLILDPVKKGVRGHDGCMGFTCRDHSEGVLVRRRRLCDGQHGEQDHLHGGRLPGFLSSERLVGPAGGRRLPRHRLHRRAANRRGVPACHEQLILSMAPAEVSNSEAVIYTLSLALHFLLYTSSVDPEAESEIYYQWWFFWNADEQQQLDGR